MRNFLRRSVKLGLKFKKEINENVDKNDNRIKSFRIELENFADDCTLVMEPVMEKTSLTRLIKYNYRVNMQRAIVQFFNWTRYYQLIIKTAKCSTITFSRKNKFRGYVYKLDGKELEIVHSHSNCPQICKHNARTQYINPNQIDIDQNGDSDIENLDENGNKRKEKQKQDDKILQIRKTGKMAKKQKFAQHELPLSFRILGVHFDPELYFNEHINIVKQKVQKKLHCLLKLAYCKYYNFNPFTIYKLFETVIRPKMEYALCTVSAATKFKELEKIQKRAIRIALQAKTQTPTKYLLEIVNGKTITEKLQEQQIKLWHKYKRAPKYLLQHHTFEKWKEYLTINDSNSINEYGNININGGTFNYVRRSPLSRAYKLVKSLYPNYRNILVKKTDSVMKPPPVYYQQFPCNIKINPTEQQQQQQYYDFYTDGSCYPNPGPGGAGFYSPNFPITSKMHIVDHDTTINYCELLAIKMVLSSTLRYMTFCKNNNISKENLQLNIFTDSQFVCDMLSPNGYPNLDYYYQLLQVIFDLSEKLNQEKIHPLSSSKAIDD